tara:strand:+ start:650 stop:1249 length:600 start_codon:yes stop_codon:yes gene_type:complete
MKFPKHLILDVSDVSIIDNSKTTLKRYDSIYKFTKKQSSNTPFYLIVKQNFSINNAQTNSLQKLLLETNEQAKYKLYQNLGTLGEQSTAPLFNICFLRKEDIYTKLKYSRCPQYDMVSGGLAALFAAFLGFLICEKFGLELLDSGDFYIAFMYGVFGAFSLRPLFRSMSKSTSVYNVLSPKHLFNFLFIVFNLIVKFRR